MFGSRLREARERLGLSQRELAKLCNLGEAQIFRYEGEKNDPSSKHLRTIAEALHVTTDYLLGLTSDPESKATERQLTDDERYILDRFRHEGWTGLAHLAVDRLAGAQSVSDNSAIKE